MHREYLREHNPIHFDALRLDGTLWTYLAELNEQAQTCLELIIEQMKASEGVTEDLKATDQMAWVRALSNICYHAEEIVINEMIYNYFFDEEARSQIGYRSFSIADKIAGSFVRTH